MRIASEEGIKGVAEIVLKAKYALALTGAGISVEKSLQISFLQLAPIANG